MSLTDDQYERQKARIQRLMKRWHEPLGMAWWTWDLSYHRGAISDESPRTVFKIYVRFRYQDVRLHSNLDLVQDMNDDDLEQAFVHEMAHVFTIPLKTASAEGWNAKAINDLEEHQATSIGRSLQWLREAVERPRTEFPTDEY